MWLPAGLLPLFNLLRACCAFYLPPVVSTAELSCRIRQYQRLPRLCEHARSLWLRSSCRRRARFLRHAHAPVCPCATLQTQYVCSPLPISSVILTTVCCADRERQLKGDGVCWWLATTNPAT